jgi:hypothetical protein
VRHSSGPWRWELNEKSRRIQLCGGVPRHDLIVMDFVRYGMNNAAPRFNSELPQSRLNVMRRAEEFGIIVTGREHHSDWFKGINHPDAQLIEAAPDYAEGVRQMLVNEQHGGDGWWAGWETLKAAHLKGTGETR